MIKHHKAANSFEKLYKLIISSLITNQLMRTTNSHYKIIITLKLLLQN